MASKALPCPTVLRQLLRYEPETGRLFWRERGIGWFKDGKQPAAHNQNAWNKKLAGVEAFTAKNENGYLVGAVFYQTIRAHRAAWAVHFGEWPSGQIDHINGDRSDNRICNLRNVSASENGKNKCVRSNNTSGQTGVSWSSKHKKWVALVWKAGRPIYVGAFCDKSDAVAARKTAEEKYGYHKNHGRDVV